MEKSQISVDAVKLALEAVFFDDKLRGKRRVRLEEILEAQSRLFGERYSSLKKKTSDQRKMEATLGAKVWCHENLTPFEKDHEYPREDLIAYLWWLMKERSGSFKVPSELRFIARQRMYFQSFGFNFYWQFKVWIPFLSWARFRWWRIRVWWKSSVWRPMKGSSEICVGWVSREKMFLVALMAALSGWALFFAEKGWI